MFGSLALLQKQRQEVDAQEAAWLRGVAEYDRSGDWGAEGFQSAAAALHSACNMDVGVAHAHVRMARRLERLPEVFDAFSDGDISARHAAAITDAYTPKRAPELSDCAPALVEAARSCVPKKLGQVVRYLTDAIDGDDGAGEEERAYESRACFMSMSAGTLHFSGSCDAVMGEAILTAVNAAMTNDLQAADTRSTPKRRMDAVFHLLRSALDRGDVGESHHVRPHISLVADITELPGVTPKTVAEVLQTPRRHGLSRVMLEMLLCDCDVSRVLMAGESEVLDVGRATRYPTAAQWKALVARDRHCTAPGCTRPPEYCQAHHDIFWTRNGPTDLKNLRLLCWHHHRQHHIEEAKARARTANRGP